MHKNRVVPPTLKGKFTNGFKKRESFNISSSPSNLSNYHVSSTLFTQLGDPIFNLVGHMRDNLHSLAQIITPPLFLQNGQINPPTGEIIKLGELRVGKSFVMAEVQIRFGPIIQNIYLTMLEGAHGSRIHI